MNKRKTLLILFGIILVGLTVRIYGINWDGGYHMHPDERAIILSVTDLSYPSSVSEFLSTESPWNPKFFAYGSFPFYLLRITGDVMGFIDPVYAQYDGINLVGRVLSAFFDIGTIILIYLLGKKLFSSPVGLISSALYAGGILPIQLSHFYAVDTLLTFFTTATLLLLIHFYEKPSVAKALLIGLSMGAALATKISATVLISSFGLTLLLEFVLIVLRAPHKFSLWSIHITPTIKRIFIYGTITIFAGVCLFAVLQPYTFIDSERFMQQITEQSKMTKDAFTFPYTFQYVGKTPYLYELKNIFFYGLGPLITVLGVTGFCYSLYRVIFREHHFPWEKMIILLQFFITYFLITGSFAIGFMRYMLPVYPMMCLFAGINCFIIYRYISKKNPALNISMIILGILVLIIPALSFLSIYSRQNTRIQATEWIFQNIPDGAVIATEHWDDVVPIRGQENYFMLSLPLYEPDTKEKWDNVNGILEQTDYIILGSNRLSAPLSRLTDCRNLPANRCYLRTALYYKELFDGSMGFEKIAEFTSFPTLPFSDITVNDQGADESFTVYDHPKITIFKKISAYEMDH